MGFQSLSPEILFNVAEILASEHMPSLHAFSLASRFCCEIANAHRFRGIHFHIHLDDKLVCDLAHWEEVLSQHAAFSSVRRLSLNTNPGFDGDGLLGKDLDIETYPGPKRSCFHREDEWTDMYRTWGFVDDRAADHDAQDRAWAPMVRFLRKLSGLRDLFWLQHGQFPRCLLDVLHAEVPRCRLHLRIFAFGDLIRNPDDRDRYEYSLATSPALGSIACRLGSGGMKAAHAQHITTQMVAGSAPNLERAFLGGGSHTKSGLSGWDNILPSGQEEKLCAATTGQRARESKVRSLNLLAPSAEDLAGLAKHLSFDSLTTLSITSYTRPDSCTRPDILAPFTLYDFSSLKCLVLRLHPSGLSEDAKALLDRDTTRLLASLPPLQSLLITGHSIESPIRDALQYHGASLRKLGILHTGLALRLKPETIMEIGAKSPRLRDLTLRIPRSMGNADEVRYYRALGEITHLNTLTIDLDCACLVNPNPPTDRHALINIAIDETLVRSILSLVTPAASSLLERLDVYISRVRIETRDAQDLEELSQETTWQVFRDRNARRNGDGGGVFVHRHLKDRRAPLRDVYRDDSWARYRHVPCQRAFRELWPDKGEGGFWWDDVCSFPLEEEVGAQ